MFIFPTKPVKVSTFFVYYVCPRATGLHSPIREVTETDTINAILAARAEERMLTGANCPECVLVGVKLAS